MVIMPYDVRGVGCVQVVNDFRALTRDTWGALHKASSLPIVNIFIS